MSEEINRETLSAILEYTQEAPERQIKDVEALDTKMVQIFSAASIVIGLAGVSSASLPDGWLISTLLVLAVLVYGLTTLVAFLHLLPRTLYRALLADELWEKFWYEETSTLEHDLVDKIGKAYKCNKIVLQRKAVTIRCGIVTAGLEVLLVGAALIFARLG